MSDAKLSVVERLFPKFAANRLYYQEMLLAAKERNYKSGKIEKRNGWVPVNATAEATDAQYRPIVKARARDLERNSDGTEAILGALERNVIGTGIIPQAKVRHKSGDFNETVNKNLEKLWKWWVKYNNCDITQQQTFYEIQKLLLRRRVVDGEILVRPVFDSNLSIPLRIQLYESDVLDNGYITNFSPEPGRHIISGIEVDDFYCPIAYHIAQVSPDGWSQLQAKRIPSEQIMHLFRKTRPTQVRGISELAAVIPLIKDTGDYLEAELVAARIAASFAVFITSQNTNSVGRIAEKDEYGRPIERISPGMIERLKPGESIEAANPNRNASAVSDYVLVQDRRAAAATGQSYEVVSRDMSKSTYSSARQGHLEDRKSWIPVQHYIVNHFCQPVWEQFVTACVLAGEIKAPDFWDDRERYFECAWIAPGWTWIDPLKDTKAAIEEIKAGMTNLSEICAEQGKDYQEVLEQLAREQEYAEKVGLQLEIFRNGGA